MAFPLLQGTLLTLASALHGGSFPGPPPCTIGGGHGGNTPPTSTPPGGTYVGPGDTAPAGGANPGAAPASPGIGPATPAPSTPTPATPAPVGPRSGPAPTPLTPAPGPRTVTPGGTGGQTQDLFHWSHWWHLERDLFLWDPERLRRPPVSGDGAGGPRFFRPTGQQAVQEVLPELLALLETSRHDDIQTSCLVAIARIGSRIPPLVRGPVLQAIRAKLAAPSLEVAETAALSLGILGGEASVAPLIELLEGAPAGAAVSGRGSVPVRMRAFAAYGLGLVADAADDANVAMRQRIAHALLRGLELQTESEDVQVACALALGLTELPVAPAVPPADLRGSGLAPSVVNRGALLRRLTPRLLGDESVGGRLAPRVEAHALIALARAAEGADARSRQRAIETLVATGESRTAGHRARAAAWIGLGELLHCGALDELPRRALARALRTGQPLERRFAAMALARAGSRPGPGDAPFEGAEVVRRELLARLARGTKQEQTWAALAVGLQAHGLGEHGVRGASAPGRGLLERLGKDRNASTVGAFAIAAALCHVHAPEGAAQRVIEASREAVARIADPPNRGHVAIGLGMLGDHKAIPALDEILQASRFQPETLWSTAVALHLVGERDVTPTLIEVLGTARSGISRAAAAAALGRVGDDRAVAPLLALMKDETQISSARAFAAVGLGVLCDESPTPWRVPIATALPYASATPTLWGGGRGVLDIL